MRFLFHWFENGQDESTIIEGESFPMACYNFGAFCVEHWKGRERGDDFRLDVEEAEQVFDPIGEPIEWVAYSPGSFNPDFTGYDVGEYSTGAPHLGWCLYSRGGGGCWEQRTKAVFPPEPGLSPMRIEGQWRWVK